MNKSNLKIGWQKYENILEEQMSSPLLSSIIQKQYDMQTEEQDEEEYYQENENAETSPLIVPIDKKTIEEISMVTSFDCWVGHTNFNITQDTKSTLDSIEGVEVLKIMSRYRFFVGIGKMFEFKNVRKSIEKALTKGDHSE